MRCINEEGSAVAYRVTAEMEQEVAERDERRLANLNNYECPYCGAYIWFDQSKPHVHREGDVIKRR